MSDDARADEYRDLLDDVVDGHALDSNQVDAIRDLLDERDSLAAEVDRLRARVAELETAGDRVVDLVDGESDLSGVVRDVVDDLRRAVRGER